MSDWTTPEGRAKLRRVCGDWSQATEIPGDVWRIAEMVPAILDALVVAECERGLYLARLRDAHGALADASDAPVPTDLGADIAPAIRRLTEQRDEARVAMRCDACLGTGKALSGPCGCGGTGLLADMLSSVRRAFTEARQVLATSAWTEMSPFGWVPLAIASKIAVLCDDLCDVRAERAEARRIAVALSHALSAVGYHTGLSAEDVALLRAWDARRRVP